jgi:hypothetical protein
LIEDTLLKDTPKLLSSLEINENLETFLNFMFSPTRTPSSIDVKNFCIRFVILVKWESKVPKEEKKWIKGHMKPVLKATDINKCKKPIPLSSKPPYYIRSARTALIFANGKNLKDIIIKNPLSLTTFCTSYPDVFKLPISCYA